MDSFNISGEAISLAKKIFYIYCTGAIFLYPASFVLPNALRAAGDIKYTMIASLSTMFGARIGLAYVLGKHFGLGLLGVWIAMQLDWIARSIAFVKRFVLGKWKIIRII
jgi:Na+-driven multidrug efflux pump